MPAKRIAMVALPVAAIVLFMIFVIANWEPAVQIPAPEDREDYREWDDYVKEIQLIVDTYDHITRLHVIGRSHEDRPIYALEISDSPGVYDGRPESLHEANIHAGEWASAEVAMDLAWHLVTGYGSDEQVTNILETISTWIVPVFNPDGMVFHEPPPSDYFGNSYYAGNIWRKNRRDNSDGTYGVDLNRNFSYNWGGFGSSDPGNPVYYRGPEPYSEPEAQAYRDILLNHDFITVLSGHTPQEVIFYFDETGIGKKIADQMEKWNGYEPRAFTSPDGPGVFIQNVARGICLCPEYGKVLTPPFQGMPAPGLETDKLGLIEANRMMYAVLEKAGGELVHCGEGRPGQFPDEVAGNIALIRRGEDKAGEITYETEAQMAALHGAVAAVIYNHSDGYMRRPTLGVEGLVDIPVIVLRGEDGSRIMEVLQEGETITAEIIPDKFIQDCYLSVWERNLPAMLYVIEQAAVHASVIEGAVTDAATGEPVEATLEKTVSPLYAPLAGPREGEVMEHKHQTSLDVNGSYRWHVLPGKQPNHDNPPYEITVSAPGYAAQTVSLSIEGYGETHLVNFELQRETEGS